MDLNPIRKPWTLATLLCLGLALCVASCDKDKDDTEGDSEDDSGDAGEVIDGYYDDWGCSENPTDSCSQAICSLLTAARALSAVPGYQDAAVCVTTLADCYEAACVDPENVDGEALATCGTNYYTCLCSVESLKSYLGSQCDALQ
jgi:hypothetical protein